MKRPKLIWVSTVPTSLNTFCRGLFIELSHDYEVVAVSSPGDELLEIAQRERVKVIAVPMERHISLWKDLRSLLLLAKVFRQERPTMVHSITPKAGLLAMLAARIAHVPVRIHTFTGLVFPTAQGLMKQLLMRTDRITCACATHVIAEGQGVRNDLIDYGITRKDVRVLGHGNVRGIDLEYYSRSQDVMRQAIGIRKSLKILGKSFTFVFVGRIVKDKGMRELIAAFHLLYNRYPNVYLILVGKEEPKLDPLPRETRESVSFNSHIHAVGMQEDVRPWYAAADALVFPSYREGFPNVVLEAGAMGLPSIVTDINGAREIILRGKNGMVIPPKNEQTLLEAMIEMIEHPDKTQAWAANARPMIASRYEQGYVRQCLKEFYKSIL